MKQWIQNHPWQFAIVSNLLSTVIGAALGVALDLVKFFPGQYNDMMRDVARARLEVQKDKQDLEQTKAKFLTVVSDYLDRLPRYEEIAVLNEPWKAIGADLATLREAAQKREHLDGAIGTAFQLLQAEAVKQSTLLTKLNQDLRADFQRQAEQDRGEIKRLREDADALYAKNRQLQERLEQREAEAGERRSLAEAYAGLANELGVLYVATFKDESFVGRLSGAIRLPFQIVGDLARLNIADSKVRAAKAQEFAERMAQLRHREERLNAHYAARGR